MPSSSSSQPQQIVTSQNKEPWGPSQPALRTALQGATDLYTQGIGYRPYSGQTQVEVHPWLGQANTGMAGMASQDLGGTPNVLAAQGLAGNVIQNQGMVPGINNAVTGLGGVSGQYGSIYNDASGQQNPFLQGVLDTQGRKIADQVNSAMSGAGRYGSGAHTNVLSRNLAEAQLPLLAHDYEQRQQTRLAATQGQGATQRTLADLYAQGLNRAGQFSQLAPTLDQAKYMPAGILQGLGQYSTDRAQAALNDQIKLYNANQGWDWEQLARLNAIAGGAGGLGGSQLTSTPVNQPSTLQRIGGGALMGAGLGSMFGPMGAGVGAAGGGLLGLL